MDALASENPGAVPMEAVGLMAGDVEDRGFSKS